MSPEPVPVSGTDVLTWLKFNKPEVLAEAAEACRVANEKLAAASAGPSGKRVGKPRKAAAKKAAAT